MVAIGRRGAIDRAGTNAGVFLRGLEPRGQSTAGRNLPLERLTAIAAGRHEQDFNRSALVPDDSFEGITIQIGKSVFVALDAQDDVAPGDPATFGPAP